MNENSLQTSFWTMILIQTVGSVDMPGSGPRKMPAPRQYVAILLTWIVLQLVGGINASTERATAAIGWVLVLVGLVVGPFGKQVVNLFNLVGQRWAAFPASPTASSGVGGQNLATLEANSRSMK